MYKTIKMQGETCY